MQLGMIGLGKMGAGMARRLARAGHMVVAFNRTAEVAYELAAQEPTIRAAQDFDELTRNLQTPRCVWVMLPAGDATEGAIGALGERLQRGDVLVDGGNSYYKDTLRREQRLAERGIGMIDVGTSGGVWGTSDGYALMIGGGEEAVERLRPLWSALAPAADRGWGRVGPTGAGHFVKMVHNGIEYGVMQAYAEGFEIMKSKEGFSIDVSKVADLWRHGSVIRSWLLDRVADVLHRNPTLDGIAPWVSDSGEGRWAVAEAIDQGVPAPVITLALLTRLASRQDEKYAARLLAALRQEFGGHAIRTE